jgi:hypothetical protein
MENIFNEHGIPTYFFNSFYHHIKPDLLNYLYDNLYNENIDTLTWDLDTAITNEANEKNI